MLLQLPCASKCWCAGIAEQSNGRACVHISEWPAQHWNFCLRTCYPEGSLNLLSFVTCCWKHHHWHDPALFSLCPTWPPQDFLPFNPWVDPQGTEVNIKHRGKNGLPPSLGHRWPETLSDELFWILLLCHHHLKIEEGEHSFHKNMSSEEWSWKPAWQIYWDPLHVLETGRRKIWPLPLRSWTAGTWSTTIPDNTWRARE